MNKTLRLIVVTALCLLMVVCMVLRVQTFAVSAEDNNTHNDDVVVTHNNTMIDTSIIDTWCGDYSDGVLRMVGAWYYSDGVVEDECGTLWGVDVPVAEDDFLLLWIADNHTPDNDTDDVVIKVWAEVH